MAGFGGLSAAVLLLAQLFATPVALAQAIDCNRLAAQIAAASPRAGGGSQYAAAAGKQRAELARMQGYANSLGCDQPEFFGFGNRAPQCGGINAQISRMQANLQSLTQAAAYGGDGARAALQQRFDTYCRGAGGYGTATNFFEQLFGGGTRRPVEETPQIMVSPEEEQQAGSGARGGSQALCVRTCDGGYFPMSVAASRRDLGDLQELCAALCPGTEAKLFTRVPGRDLSTAVSVAGDAYADLPNALKFEKTFDKSCTCKPADKTWVQALADAERLLGENRRGDIVVTPERAEELSKVAGPAGGRERAPRKTDGKSAAKAGAPAVIGESVPPAGQAGAPANAVPAEATGGIRGTDVRPRMRVIAQ